jgi:hypothetical protein
MAVFISYRREDSEGDARALYNRLAEETDESNLFLDFEAIGAGDNWRSRIDDTLKKVKAVLVVIGPQWLDTLKARAAAGGADLVRSEIAASLAKAGVRVIPVIVKGAKVPSSDTLPDDIKSLADRNAIEVRGSAWTTDTDRLIKILRRAGALPTSRRSWMLRGAVAAAVLAAIGAVFAARVTVPSVPKDMSYKYAKALLESHGLGFQPRKLAVGGGDDRGIDVVADQRPAAGSTLFMGQTVEVDLLTKQPYWLVCRAGGVLGTATGGDTLEFEKHNGTPSLDMKEGSCSWVTGAIVPNQDSVLKPLGFKDELADRFAKAPGGFLAFCAFSQYDLPNPKKSERLVLLSYDEYMIKDDAGQLHPRTGVGSHICVDRLP